MSIEFTFAKHSFLPMRIGGAETGAAAPLARTPIGLVAVAQNYGISTEDLMAMMKGQECLVCGHPTAASLVFPTASQWLFNLGRPQHNAGWGNFYDWLERTDRFTTLLFPRAENIWDYLVSETAQFS